MDKIMHAFQAAAEDPAERGNFYKLLYDSPVYLLVTPNPHVYGDVTGVLAQETLPVVFWEKQDGSKIVPFFSSRKALREALGEEDCLKMPAKTVFELTRGLNLVLNPQTPYAKEFFPGEVEAIISGEIYSMELAPPAPEEDEIEKDRIHYAVLFSPGPNWLAGKEMSEQPHAIEHIRHYASMQTMGHLMMGGPFFSDKWGSLMVCHANITENGLRDIAASDPAVREGIIEFEIIPWYLVFDNPTD